ncbi:MAG TPA: DNA polymerase, partial [Gemmatimonadales bacterium]|nr:DNA polymerase [Gemmatimonadales bacterium]
LFLIDGYALIYRAFYAMISRPLRTAKGENTSAAWGVVNFLLRLREKYRPDYVAWINDAGTSFREQRYADYKSTRQKLDQELQADFNRSVERICDLLEAFGIPLVAIKGYEADDVIGTLAQAASERGMQAVIVSGDKDFYQLVGPGIALLNPGRGGPAAVDEVWVDESNAVDRLGVPPRQVVDFLALVGDSSDNIPGVKGIGEKGAQKLLAEFGDLETMLARAGEVSAKRPREALLSQAENARLSRELVTIKRDVPVELDVGDFVLREPDRDTVIRLLTELEFYTLVRRLTDATAPQEAGVGDTAEAENGKADEVDFSADSWLSLSDLSSPSAPSVSILDNPDDLPGLVERLRSAPLVGIDVEAGGREPHDAEIVGLSLAASPEELWYLPFGHRPAGGELAAPNSVRNLQPLTDVEAAPLLAMLTDPSVPKAGHDIKYDWQVLRAAGVELKGVVYDSMLASFVLDPGRRSHTIDTLCLEHLGRTLQTYPDLTGKGKSEIPFAEVAVPQAASYCGTDSATVLSLHRFFEPMLQETALEPLLQTIEMPLLEVLVDVEWSGITIDLALFRKLGEELGGDLRRLEQEIARAAGTEVNLNSPRQLASVLFERLQLPVLKKTKTGPSTDADVLEQLAAMGHELPRLILEYRELQKLKNTYIDTLPTRINRYTGRIHTSFNQAGAATGRLSSA